MADGYLLETGTTDRLLLEDGSGVYLLDAPTPGSVRFDASGEQLTRTGGLGLTGNTLPFTMCLWAKRMVDRGAFSVPLSIGDGTTADGEVITTQADGDTIQTQNIVGSDAVVGPTVANDEWWFLAAVVESTDVTFRWRVEGAGSLTSAAFGAAPNAARLENITQLDVGTNAWGQWWNGSACLVRIWDAALSEAELLDESQSATAVRATNLQGAWRLFDVTDLADQSGNGRTLTGGTGAANDADFPTLADAAEPFEGPITAAVETDTAAATLFYSFPADPAAETDTAQTIVAGAPAQSEPIAAAAETDAAVAVTAALATAVTVDAATETDQAQTVTVGTGTNIELGAATETDLAAATLFYSLPVGRPLETDAAQPITEATGGAQSQPITVALETDAAAGALSFTLAPDPATETDTAQPVATAGGTVEQAAAASEADAAQPVAVVAGVVTVVAAPASETDEAPAVTVAGGTATPVSPAVEADTAVAVAGITVGAQPAAETDTAVTIAAGVAQQVAATSEVDAAQPVTAVVGVAAIQVGVAAEADAALTIAESTGGVFIGVDLAAEADAGQALTVGLVLGQPATAAVETDAAQPLGRTVAQPIAAATETSLAVGFTVEGGSAQQLGVAAETDVAVAVTGSFTVPVGAAVEVDGPGSVRRFVPFLLGVAGSSAARDVRGGHSSGGVRGRTLVSVDVG